MNGWLSHLSVSDDPRDFLISFLDPTLPFVVDIWVLSDADFVSCFIAAAASTVNEGATCICNYNACRRD